MGPHGRDDDRKIRRLRLQEGVEARVSEEQRATGHQELVFDFTGLQRPDLCDLSFILTAWLTAGRGDRVWVRALPIHTWRVLHALGLDHLFQPFPAPEEQPN